MNNLTELFLQNTAQFSGKIAFAEFTKEDAPDPYGKIDGEYLSYTYGALREMVDKVALYLKSKGMDEHSKIALLAENSSYWPVVYFASLRIGAAVVPLDTQLHEKDNIHYLRHSESDILFTNSGIYENMDIELAGGLNIKEVILMDGSGKDGVPALSDIITEDIREDEKLPAPDTIPSSSTAAILYTSGTTGSPKGVCLTHGNLLHQAQVVPRTIEYDSKDVFIGILPLFHSFPATACMLSPMVAGCKVVFPKSIKATTLVKVMKAQSVSIMVGVPALFESLKRAIIKKVKNSSIFLRAAFGAGKGITKTLNLAGINAGKKVFAGVRSKAGLGNIRIMVSGGAPLMKETARFYELMGIDFIEGYGLSETAPVLTVNNGGPRDSVGKAMEGVKLRITNPDSNGVGMIEAAGPNLMEGYYKNSRATSQTISGEWFKTGDLGCIDKDGYLYLKGRDKNVIVSSAGKNIYPEEIENKILKSPFIMECMVYGRQESEDNRGEIVSALIYPDFDAIDEYFSEHDIEETTADIKTLVNDEIKKYTKNLPAYKKIKKFRIQQEEFAKTTTRKIKRYLYAE